MLKERGGWHWETSEGNYRKGAYIARVNATKTVELSILIVVSKIFVKNYPLFASFRR